MFEQSVTGSGRRPWSFAISLLAQTALLGLVLLATLMYTPLLPAARFTAVLLEPPPPPPGPPPPPPENVVMVKPQVFQAELRTPVLIPEKTPIIVDVATPVERPYVGVPGGFGLPGGSGVIDSIGAGVPPPKPPEPKIEKKPEPPPAPSGPLRVVSDIQAAKIVRRVEPVYPDLAIKTRTSGKVRLRATISPEGAVEQLSVIGGHPLLIPAAVSAVRQWRYRPTILNGKPVPVITEIEVNFVLR